MCSSLQNQQKSGSWQLYKYAIYGLMQLCHKKKAIIGNYFFIFRDVCSIFANAGYEFGGDAVYENIDDADEPLSSNNLMWLRYKRSSD